MTSFVTARNRIRSSIGRRTGMRHPLRDVAELCPEAATSRQRDRWRIFQFCCHLAKTQKAITQRARRYADPCRIADGLGCTQSWISKQFGGKTLGWTTFRQIFRSLYNHTIGDGIFSPDDIQHTDLREWLELPPIEVLKVCFDHAKTLGWFDLVEILSTAHPEVIAGFLGVLAAATGMDLFDDWPPSLAPDG